MTTSSNLEKTYFQGASPRSRFRLRAASKSFPRSRSSASRSSPSDSLADCNHVVLRALAPLQEVAERLGDAPLAARCQAYVEKEQLRIHKAVRQLFVVSSALEAAGCPTTVMKSLEHWPDFGSDLDLYTTASASQVCQAMRTRFKACLEPQSWGDRLANKWNSKIAGLPEAIEVHAHAGQTGEQLQWRNALSRDGYGNRLSSSNFWYQLRRSAS